MNYKIILEMFHLILQYHCFSFKGCFKSEMSKKINGILEDLSKIFLTFSIQSSPNEAVENLTEKFIDKTESMLKEIELCSLDSDDDKNAIVNQSRPFDSFCDLPSFSESFASTKSLHLSSDHNEINKKGNKDVNSTTDATKIEEIAPFPDGNVDILKSKISNLEREIDTYQKAISTYKYDIDLKEKRISILQDKTNIQKQIIDRFEDDLASNAKMDLSPCSSSKNNVTTTFTDQACQYNYMEGISLISSGLNETGEQDLSSLITNLCSNCEKSLIETEVPINKDLLEIPSHISETLSLTDSEKENIIEEHKIYLEATLNDLTELKLFGLNFMKRDMKKEYLWDVDSLEQQGKFPVQDQIKIEVTALKEMLHRLEFYSRDQAESAEHFNKFFEEQLAEIPVLEYRLNQSDQIVKEKETELKELKEALFNMEKDLDELVHKIKFSGSLEDHADVLKWQLDLSMVIKHTSKTLNCIARMQHKILQLDKSIYKKLSLIDDMSQKLKETQEKLRHFQEKDKKTFKLNKSVQTVGFLEYLELSQKLEETENSREALEDERKELQAKFVILIKEKEDLQKELEDKIKLYCDKLKNAEIKFEAEKQEWTANTVECVKRAEEKCDEMMTEQENKFFDEIRQIKHEHNLQLLKNDSNIHEQWQRLIDQLKEEHERNESEIKSRLLSEIQEKHKMQSQLTEEINVLKKNIDHYHEFNSRLKCRGKQLVIELQEQKEKFKSLEQKEKDHIQNKTNVNPEKLLDNKETQTSIHSAKNVDEHYDVCSQCRILQKQISDFDILKQKELTDDAKKRDALCKRLQNELEEKKAKILSLNRNNEKMVNEITALKKELTSKTLLLRNCHCRTFFAKAETENCEKLKAVKKDNGAKYKECDKEAKPSELKSNMNPQDILQMDIVQQAILKAREEEIAIFRDGNGPASMMKCYLLQGKINKQRKEIDLLKKQCDDLKMTHHVKNKTKGPSNQAFAVPTDFEENVTVYTKTDPFPDACNPKWAPKKILEERNPKTITPYQLNTEMKKCSDFDVENVYPAATLPVLQEEKTNKNSVKIDKAEATRREIESLASGEPQCKQQ